MNWIKRTIKDIKSSAKKIFKHQEKIVSSSSLFENCPSCGKLNYRDGLRESDWICDYGMLSIGSLGDVNLDQMINSTVGIKYNF